MSDEEYVREGSIEMAALRQLIYRLADGETEEYEHLAEAVGDAVGRVEGFEERLAELEAENQNLRTRMDALGDIGAEKSSKEQKIAAIVTYADNARSDGQPAITVKPETIKGLVDVSKRYAYNLVDDMVYGDGENGTVGPDGYDWAHDPRELPRHLEQDAPEKGVTIDFEGVHGDAVPLNKFINGTTGQGVSG